jgi:hypothetical protein
VRQRFIRRNGRIEAKSCVALIVVDLATIVFWTKAESWPVHIIADARESGLLFCGLSRYVCEFKEYAMLRPEQVIPFLLHDDRIVREHAQHYFRDTYDVGPLTADHYWAAIDRLGESDSTLGYAVALGDLPQTDASLRRLIQALAAKPSDDFDYHYQHAVRDMEMAVLVRNRDELLACPQLLPHVRKHLELRLSLLDLPPVEAWDRLMQRGIEIGEEYAGSFDTSPSDALIEAAARGGTPVGERAILTVGDESASQDWRGIFAVRVLGRARYEPAVDVLVDQFSFDTDVMREDVDRALARIATQQVIDRIVSFYPGKNWHVRLYAHVPIGHIKRPESELALLKLLDVELAFKADPNYDDEGPPLIEQILSDLTEIGSLAGLDETRRLLAEFPDDLEVLNVCEGVLATAIMTGVTLPEEAAWRKLIADADNRTASRAAHFGGMFGDVFDNWRKTGMNFPPGDPAASQPASKALTANVSSASNYVERVQPIRNTTPKVGRNDPCPCGSGKKYKKCCGK